MKLSPYFHELSSSYAYEIEDLRFDSGGDDVLKKRLKDKHSQFGELLKMIDSFPVMVVPAFHGGFRFPAKEMMEKVVGSKPGEFPAWADVAATLEMEAWAKPLVQRALQEAGGEEFMLIAAGLEYILGRLGPEATAGSSTSAEADEHDGDDDQEDLGEAGEDYLGEQGFDRRS